MTRITSLAPMYLDLPTEVVATAIKTRIAELRVLMAAQQGDDKDESEEEIEVLLSWLDRLVGASDKIGLNVFEPMALVNDAPLTMGANVC